MKYYEASNIYIIVEVELGVKWEIQELLLLQVSILKPWGANIRISVAPLNIFSGNLDTIANITDNR